MFSIKEPTLFHLGPSRHFVLPCPPLDPPSIASCSSSPLGEAIPALNSASPLVSNAHR